MENNPIKFEGNNTKLNFDAIKSIVEATGKYELDKYNENKKILIFKHNTEGSDGFGLGAVACRLVRWENCAKPVLPAVGII